MTASPGRARVAATQETNFPMPHPTRISDCGFRIADLTLEFPIRNPQSTIRNCISSMMLAGPPYSPSNPSVPTYALPSSAGSITGLTWPSAASRRENCAS